MGLVYYIQQVYTSEYIYIFYDYSTKESKRNKFVKMAEAEAQAGEQVVS